jgi:hypothetical protein
MCVILDHGDVVAIVILHHFIDFFERHVFRANRRALIHNIPDKHFLVPPLLGELYCFNTDFSVLSSCAVQEAKGVPEDGVGEAWEVREVSVARAS